MKYKWRTVLTVRKSQRSDWPVHFKETMRILILGQNPSKSNKDPDVPFEGTRSGKILQEWINHVLPDHSLLPEESYQVELMNVTNDPDYKFTAGNIKFLATKIKTVADQYQKVVTLGKISDKICTIAGVEHFPLPHPSGRNRKLNDKRYITEILDVCHSYLNMIYGD